MDVDNAKVLPINDAEPSFNEEEVLAKAGFAIIQLPYLQTTPTT
jgi:hypothetical protein